MTSQLDLDLSRISSDVHELLMREIDSSDGPGSLQRSGYVRDMLIACLLDCVYAEAYLYLVGAVPDGS